MSAGSRHWRWQRLSSVALVPLGLWFLGSLLGLPDGEHATLLRFLSQPMAAVLAGLLAVVALWHSLQGLQVVVEDYVGGGLARATLAALRVVHGVAALASAWAVASILLAGPP